MSHEPQRIRLERTRGWRKPARAVTVARPSPWGNPYTTAGAIENGYACTEEQARLVAAEWFGRWLLRLEVGDQDRYMAGPSGKTLYDRNWMWDHRGVLYGLDLACWCPLPEPGHPDICHGAVLLAWANGSGWPTWMSL